MLNLVLCCAALLGLLAGQLLSIAPVELVLSSLAGALTALVAPKRYPMWRLLALACCAVALGALRATLDRAAQTPDVLPAYFGLPVTVRGTVDGLPTLGPRTARVVVDVVAVAPAGQPPSQPTHARIAVVDEPDGDLAHSRPGDVLDVQGRLRAPSGPGPPSILFPTAVRLETGEPSSPPAAASALLQSGEPSRPSGTDAPLLRSGVPNIELPDAAAWLQVAEHSISEHARDVLREQLPAPQGALAAGVTLGGSAGLDAEFRLQLQRSGLAHVLAIDGFKLVIVAGALEAIARPLLGARGATVLVVPGALGYTLLTGARPSAVRALLMLLVALAARLGGRMHDPLTALWLAATAMAAVEPSILLDVGFQLSASAALGLIVLWPRLRRTMLGGLQSDQHAARANGQAVGGATANATDTRPNRPANAAQARANAPGNAAHATANAPGNAAHATANASLSAPGEQGITRAMINDQGLVPPAISQNSDQDAQNGLARRLVRALAEPAGLTVAVTLATLPVTISTFQSVSLVSPFAHIVAVPLLAPVLATAVILVISASLAPGSTVASIATAVAWLPSTLLAGVATFFGELPGAALSTGHLALPVAVSLEAVLLGWAVWGAPECAALRTWASAHTNFVAPLATIALCIPALWLVALVQPDGKLHVYVLQRAPGDAVLVRGPTGDTALVLAGRVDRAALVAAVADTLPVWEHGVDELIVLDPPARPAASFLVQRYSAHQQLEPDNVDGRLNLGGGAVLETEAQTTSASATFRQTHVTIIGPSSQPEAEQSELVSDGVSVSGQP